MLRSDFLIASDKGYYCKYGNFYIDAMHAVEHNVVSHAHADHAREGSRNVYCSQVTSEIMQLRYKHKAAKAFYLKPFLFHNCIQFFPFFIP